MRRLHSLIQLCFFVAVALCALPAPQAWADKPAPEEKKKDTGDTKPDDAKSEDADKDDEDKKEEKKDVYFAVTGATVHTLGRGDLYDATVLVKNGRIAEMGRGVVIPEDTGTLDASGYHIYPGLVAVRGGNIIGGGSADETTDVYSLWMTIALASGITTAVSGETAVALTFGTVEDMVVKRDLFVSLRYSTTNPKQRRKVREGFEKVRQYMRDLQAFNEKKKLDPEAEEPDKEWLTGDYEKYYKLLKHETVAKVSANSAHEINQFCELAERYGIRLVIDGALEGWTVARRMARAGVSAILTIRPPLFSTDTGEDQRLNRATGRSIENAAILHKHGVPIAIVPATASITSWGLAGRDLLHLNMEAAFAVRGGLPEEAALRSITIDAAQILGIDHRVGSLEIGKDGNFMITDGDPLHYMTHVRWTVVNGRLVYDKQKDSLYSHIRPNGDRDAPPPDDYWPRRLGDGQ